MSPRLEHAFLREVGRIYRQHSERVAFYTRRKLVATATAWILIFVAFFLVQVNLLGGILCLVLALLGGLSLGFAILFSTSAKQIPFLVRYTTLHDDAIEQRLEELKHAGKVKGS